MNDQLEIYQGWWAAVVSSGLTGDLIWQAGANLSTGPSNNDGYAIYPNSDVYPAMESAAASLKAART